MDKLTNFAEWLGSEWLRFLVWFSVGLFAIPIGLSVVTVWINLDRFYDGLIPGNLNVGVVLLVVSPYLLYLAYRLLHARDTVDHEYYEEEQELSHSA
jgi:hypothetical protein